MLNNGLKYCDECKGQIFLVERAIPVLEKENGVLVTLHFHNYEGRACYTAFFIRRAKEVRRDLPEYEAT